MLMIKSRAELEHSHPAILESMFRLRARQFADRRGWRVEVRNGMESDRFDAMNPVYVCYVDGSTALASLRILPTTGPYMMADVFPEVMGAGEMIRHPLIWESSRFCVDTDHARTYAEDGINLITRSLLFGLFSTAYRSGILNVVSVYDLYLERILRRAGCRFDRLGPVVAYDGLKTVAGLFEVSAENIAELQGNLPDLVQRESA